MKIPGIQSHLEAYKKIDQITKPSQPDNKGAGEAVKGADKGFGGMLTDAIREVDGLQKTADSKVEDLVLGKSASPHEAMIALEKADVAFQLMNSVRSKIIRAYEEIMRAQV